MKKETVLKTIQELYAAYRYLFRLKYEESISKDVTQVESRFIGFIADRQEEGSSVISKDLVLAFGVGKPVVSENMRSLVKKGYVQFVTDQVDRRKKTIVLTEKGMEYHRRVTPVLDAFASSFEDVLGKEEMKQWTASSAKLLAAMKERGKSK